MGFGKRKKKNIGKHINYDQGKVIALKGRRLKKVIYRDSGDFILSLCVLGLVLFGVLMVFSASYYSALSKVGTPYYYLIRDGMWAILGTVVMLSLASYDYHRFKKWAWWILIISFLLLIALFTTPFGIEINNATRWLGYKGFTVMPGELAKPALIIFTAAFLSSEPDRIRKFSNLGRGRILGGYSFLLLIAGAMFFLIYKQPNLSTACTVVIIILGMLFISGIKIFHFILLIGTGIAGAVTLILTKGGFHLERIIDFRHPENDLLGNGYQVYQSLISLGSGGLKGVGLGNSIQKTLYLPEPQNDFILAIIGEELGYVRVLMLLAVYLTVIWRCVYIAIKAPDMFGRLIATGVSVMLAIQVIFNVLIVTAWMPPTGIILPFISWGGNALIIFMACIGILLNISRQSEK